MNSLDEHLIHRDPEPKTVADLAWWEARRPFYNLFLLFMIGLMVWQLLPMARNFGLGQVAFWSVLYVLSANVFYCLGFLLPVLLKYYLRTDFGLASLASVNFGLGVIVSLLTTSFVYLWWLLPFR